MSLLFILEQYWMLKLVLVLRQLLLQLKESEIKVLIKSKKKNDYE